MARGSSDSAAILRFTFVFGSVETSPMNERRVLIALLLLAVAAAFYIWGRPSAAPEGEAKPADQEVKERTGANPFPG